MNWVLDLDGVIWRGREAIDGSAEAVEMLRSAGNEVLFVTNNSSSTTEGQESKLASFDIDGGGRVVTSAHAGAQLISSIDSVYVLGGPGIVEAVEKVGARVIAESESGVEHVDAVVVGLDKNLTYDRLTIAVRAIVNGARFIATNGDPKYPTESGHAPGAGSIAAAVATATGKDPVVAGKPEVTIADLVKSRLNGDDGIMIGDRAGSDGMLARRLGYQFGLVLSGLTNRNDLPTDPNPDVVANDLKSMVQIVSDST